jgi:hypothetical protein
MSDPVEPLILDLLEWIGSRPRPYAEVLEAWRTSCPRLPVWEEANQRGFIDHLHEQGHLALVVVSALGRAHLEKGRAHGSSEPGQPQGTVPSPAQVGGAGRL